MEEDLYVLKWSLGERCSRVVAKPGIPEEGFLQPLDLIGGPCRDRTCGPLIKSQLLYQLS